MFTYWKPLAKDTGTYLRTVLDLHNSMNIEGGRLVREDIGLPSGGQRVLRGFYRKGQKGRAPTTPFP